MMQSQCSYYPNTPSRQYPTPPLPISLVVTLEASESRNLILADGHLLFDEAVQFGVLLARLHLGLHRAHVLLVEGARVGAVEGAHPTPRSVADGLLDFVQPVGAPLQFQPQLALLQTQTLDGLRCFFRVLPFALYPGLVVLREEVVPGFVKRQFAQFALLLGLLDLEGAFLGGWGGTRLWASSSMRKDLRMISCLLRLCLAESAWERWSW